MDGDIEVIVIIHKHMKLDRSTAYFAVFNILLFRYAAVDQHCEMLATVWAHDGVFFQWMKHGLASISMGCIASVHCVM